MFAPLQSASITCKNKIYVLTEVEGMGRLFVSLKVR